MPHKEKFFDAAGSLFANITLMEIQMFKLFLYIYLSLP